jgi:phage terminase large subunit
LFKDILAKWQLKPPVVKVNESDFRIRFSNGSEIIMMGLDDEHKLLSLNDISVIWIEEAYEVEKEKILQLDLRMRGTADNQMLILSWNPISKNHWLYDFTVENPPKNSIYHHSTYKTNPFLPQSYIDSLEEMKVRNPQKYRVYGAGEWGIDAEGLVFTNWNSEEFDAMELASSGLELRYGCDLGWIDKTAIVQTLYDKPNKTIYIFNEFYKSGCQLSEVVMAMREMNIGKTKLFVDSAEPRSIDYFKREGINAIGATKGKDSVKAGYMFLQDCHIVVHPSCVNMIMELENFSYIKSKITGNWTEDTTHEYSHAISGLRYAYSDIYTNKKMKTLEKSVLGL